MGKILHKIKDTTRPKDHTQLMNEDGSWNVICGNKGSSSCRGSDEWRFVTCKNCLKQNNRVT